MAPENLPFKRGTVQLIDESVQRGFRGWFKQINLVRSFRKSPEMYLTWLALVALELWVFWLTTLKESEAYWLYGAENRYSDAALYWRPVIQKAYYGIFWLHIWLVGAWVLAFLKRSVYQRTPYSGQIIWLSWFLVFVGSWNTLNLISDNLLEWITKG